MGLLIPPPHLYAPLYTKGSPSALTSAFPNAASGMRTQTFMGIVAACYEHGCRVCRLVDVCRRTGTKDILFAPEWLYQYFLATDCCYFTHMASQYSVHC